MSQAVSEFLVFLQYRLGATQDASGHPVDGTSWSAQLQSSENLWMVLEGVHVLTIMLFVGSILIVDLRLLGATLKKASVSAVLGSILPYTIAGFAVMLLTGTALFFANPLEYYYSFIFRIKAGLLLLAFANILIFHGRVQADRVKWDNAEKPPLAARLGAGISLTLWVMVVISGRYAAYDWFACDHAQGFIAAFSQCDAYASPQIQAEAALTA